MAGGAGPGQKRIGSYFVIASEFLENFEELYGRKIQKGTFNVPINSCICSQRIQPLSNSGSRRSPTQCRTMALDIVKLYISLISQTFLLSDMVVMTSATSSNYAPLPLLPKDSHSLSTAFHLQKIIVEVQDCVNDINALEISNEVTNGLKSLTESLKWRFEDVLTRDWLRGRVVLFHFGTSSLTSTLQMQRSSITSKLGWPLVKIRRRRGISHSSNSSNGI